ncbi:MAG: DNA-formamidopyrimidine glycosylase family protein [Candidatus Dormibacterales bacterium]
MPEGDTIWRTAQAMRSRLVSSVLVDAVPVQLERLRGARLVGAEPVGKHLVLRFSSGLALHSHLGMRGSWHLYPRGRAWRRPEAAARCVLDFGGWVAVLYSAPAPELIGETSDRLAHLGPDILSQDFDLEAVLRRAARAEVRTVGEMLLDQRVCAGIGNVYKCETLWALRVNPWQDPGEVDAATLRRLYLTAREFMLGNLHGFIGRRFSHGAGRGRAVKAAVHARSGRPCPRCGTLVRVTPQGEQARPTYFCPSCQGPGPRAARARSAG